MPKKKVRGLHAYRLNENAEERAFAEAWEKANDRPGGTLAYLLHVGSQGRSPPLEPEDRDKVVAATVIQWLGSHVGELFLRDLGYRKERG